jgi:hypothetical protein
LPTSNFRNDISRSLHIDIAPEGFTAMPDITQGYILQSQPVVDTTSPIVFTIAPGSAAYTALATWVAYRVANPTIPAPLFVMGDYEPTGTSSFVSSGGMGETLNINGSVESTTGVSSGVVLNSGVYSIGSGPSLVGTFIGGPYTITSRAGLVFSITVVLDNIHNVILTIPQASGSCYAGHNVKLIILPDAQVGVSAADLWANIAGATSPLPTCASPVLNPTSSALPGLTSSAVSCATPSATAHYTYDGSTPSATHGYTVAANGLYAIMVAPGTSLKVCTTATGYNDSAVVTATYTSYTAAQPVISLPAATYTTVQSAVITSPTFNTSISYTLDGSTPSPTHGTVSLAPVTVPITASCTLKAMAFATGVSTTQGYVTWMAGAILSSTIASAAYTLSLTQYPTPIFSPGAGTFTAPFYAFITNYLHGIVACFWTTDGTDPTRTHGNLYDDIAGILIDASCTLKAIFCAVTYIPGKDSAVGSVAYTVNLNQCTLPTSSPPGGTYSANQTVTLASATAGASLFYTLDNTTPSATNGTRVTTPIVIGTSCTLKVIATKAGMTDSAVDTEAYTITTSAVATPIFSPAPGTFTTPPTITITTLTSGATIRFTLDGSLPSATVGFIYSAPFALAAGTQQVNAIAYKAGSTDSTIARATYTAPAPCPVPIFQIAYGQPIWGGVLSLQVQIIAPYSCRYSTDGSTPSDTSGAPLTTSSGIGTIMLPLNPPVTVQAIGYFPGMLDSAIAKLCAPPMATPIPGAYTYPTVITLTCVTAGATIRYTTDGSLPTHSNGTVYSTPFTLSASCTLLAIAYLADYTDSAVGPGQYIIESTSCDVSIAVAPIIPAQANEWTAAATETFSLFANEGASIRYSIDGVTIPTDTVGTLYTGPFFLPNDNAWHDIKAIAYMTGLADSAVLDYPFTFYNANPPTPPGGGTVPTDKFNDCVDSGNTHHYTGYGNGSVYYTSRPVGGIVAPWRIAWTVANVAGLTIKALTSGQLCISILTSDGKITPVTSCDRGLNWSR